MQVRIDYDVDVSGDQNGSWDCDQLFYITQNHNVIGNFADVHLIRMYIHIELGNTNFDTNDIMQQNIAIFDIRNKNNN